MSSPSVTFYHAPLSDYHHFNLKTILRNANERYRIIADSCRENLHLSHHARKLAWSKGLNINTTRASKCPQKLVSVLPLPVIDASDCQAVSDELPVIPGITFIAPRPVVPRITVPVLRPTQKPTTQIFVARTEQSSSSRVFAPIALRARDNPWCGPTSRFSITPNDDLFKVHARKSDPDADVPQDMDELEDDTSSKSSWSFSSGPSTPNDDISSAVVRIKRKSLAVETDSIVVEKRPKLLRKEWIHSPRASCSQRNPHNRSVSVHSGIPHH